jgi:hypothetical protein
MTLEPFSRESAIEFLVPMLGKGRASEVVAYLEERAIPDLYGNRLTLGLFGEVATGSANLPEARAELMLRSCELMWNELNDRHDKSPLSKMDHETALDAAGVASAAFILTGAEAITLRPSSVARPHTLRAAELRSLPGGEEARTLIGSRLFSRVPDVEDEYNQSTDPSQNFLVHDGYRDRSRTIRRATGRWL